MASSFLNNFIERAADTLRRFPVTIGIVIIGTFAAIMEVNGENSRLLQDAVATCIFAAPLTAAIHLYLEQSKTINIKRALVLFSIAALLAIGFFQILPDFSGLVLVEKSSRMFIAIQISYLIGIFFPFITARESSESIWRYTYSLATQTVIMWFFSTIMFIGMSLIYTSLSTLFEIQIDGITYQRTGIFIFGIIGSWLLLSGIPEQIQKTKIQNYPNLLKNLVQFVLLPLLSIYGIILYAYGAKILLTRVWPTGGVIFLILGFIITGFLTCIIGYPLTKNTIAEKVARAFLYLIQPLLILYFAAVGIRFSSYGITENRYVVIMFGIYFFILAIYFLTSKKKKLFIIPSLLAAMLLGSIWGPWGMFRMSEKSQMNELKTILNEKTLTQEQKNRAQELDAYLRSHYESPDLSWLTEEQKVIVAPTNQFPENQP